MMNDCNTVKHPSENRGFWLLATHIVWDTQFYPSLAHELPSFDEEVILEVLKTDKEKQALEIVAVIGNDEDLTIFLSVVVQEALEKKYGYKALDCEVGKPKTFAVWHRSFSVPDTGTCPTDFPKGHTRVADVAGISSLEEAFELTTDHHERRWWENARVIPRFDGNGERSTTFGDVVVDFDGQAWFRKTGEWVKIPTRPEEDAEDGVDCLIFVGFL